MHHLLIDPLVETRLKGGEVRSLSLPDVLAGLSSSRIEAFTRLMPHQRHAWYAFLVQLAAIALHRADIRKPPMAPDTWSDVIRRLTPDYPGDEPWHLVVEDLSKPAFLQPPVPEGSLKKFKGPFHFPDEIDILVTSKNHDVKMARLRKPDPSHWIHVLVTLQTMEGFLGQGNYGISRMNGGFASRPCVSLVTGEGWSVRFLRDLRVLLDTRGQLLDRQEHFLSDNGKTLLWLEPWDGVSLMPLDLLDPYFIEVCRRVRLVEEGQRVSAWTAPTKKERLAAKALKGNLGDPWTPLKMSGPSALTVGKNGFSYHLLHQVLLTREYEPSACQKVHAADPTEGLHIHAEVMSRGQGKTEGLHQRRIPVPAEVRSLIALEEGRDRLAVLAKQRVEDTGTLVGSALKPALRALLQGGPEKLNHQDERPQKWIDEFDRRVDAVFFEDLWSSISLEEEEARKRWQESIVTLGREVLHEAKEALPLPTARRYRAIASADRCFGGSVHKNFPLLQKPKKEVP